MKNGQIVSALSLILALVMLLCSCGTVDDPNTNTTVAETEPITTESITTEPITTEQITTEEITTEVVTTAEELPKTPITSVKINGVDIKEYVIIVANTYVVSYGSPAGVLIKYLEKYCGVTITMRKDNYARVDREIVIGNTTRNEEKTPDLSTSIYMKGERIYLCGGLISDCEQVVNMFIYKYLNGTGAIDITIPNDGSIQYEWKGKDPEWPIPSNLTTQDTIITGCKKLQHYLDYDKANGFNYTYQNDSYAATIAKARSTNNGKTNCVIAVNWVMKDLKFWSSGIINIKYDGTFGYTIGNGCSSCINEKFDIIKIETPTALKNLIAQGKVLPGDIMFFKNHMQIYLDEQRAFDGGSANTGHSGQKGYPFIRFIGSNNSLNTQVGFIFRAKDAE